MEDGKILDLNELKKQLGYVLEENKKVQFNKQQQVEYSNELIKIKEILTEQLRKIDNLANNLNPTIKLKIRHSNGINFKELSEAMYILMEKGTQITIELLTQTYPHLENFQVYNILNHLKKMPQVKQAKDGKKVRLFI